MKSLIFILFLIYGNLAAQELNQIVYDDSCKQDILIGYCTSEAFADSHFVDWFYDEYENYEPLEYAIKDLENKISNITVTVIMATWCSDSQREVPRFYKIAESIGFKEGNITLINVNRLKECPNIDITKYGIEYVPTFIIYKDGYELGRIVETPGTSLEEDLMDIINDR